MQNQKGRSFRGDKVVVALLIAVLSTGSLFAKGREQRLEGTVKTMGPDFVTMETKARQVLTVKITNATKFLKSSKPSTFSEMKTGDHVVFQAIPSTDTTAKDTPSANTKSSNTQKDTLSL